MRRSLRLLERSVADGGKHKQRPAEGVAGPGYLQEQIAVVRGQHIGKPTSTLRALETRVLGGGVARSPLIPEYIGHETLRLDQEQLAPHHYPPSHAPDYPFPAEPPIAQPSAPRTIPVSAATYYANAWSVPSQHYSPEFSAPDTGRFQVESFAEDLLGNDDDDGFAMPSMPSIDEASRFQLSGQAPSSTSKPANGVGNGRINSAPKFDDNDWISAAQTDRPAKISSSSKQSLNPGLALAKDDFERELAAILGTSAASPAPDPLFTNPGAAAQPTPPAAAPAKPAEPEVIHPNHNVFDQMGLAMRYANSFDLGNVSLNDRFEHFDKDLDTGRSNAHVPQPVQTSGMTNPFVDPMNLDEFDLVAELAEIGIENPIQAHVQTPGAPGQPVLPGEPHQPSAIVPPTNAPHADPVMSLAPPIHSSTNHSTTKPINRTETTAGDGHE